MPREREHERGYGGDAEPEDADATPASRVRERVGADVAGESSSAGSVSRWSLGHRSRPLRPRRAHLVVARRQVLGHHPGLGDRGHEVRVAVPPRQGVQVQVAGHAGTGGAPEVGADVHAVGPVGPLERGDRGDRQRPTARRARRQSSSSSSRDVARSACTSRCPLAYGYRLSIATARSPRHTTSALSVGRLRRRAPRRTRTPPGSTCATPLTYSLRQPAQSRSRVIDLGRRLRRARRATKSSSGDVALGALRPASVDADGARADVVVADHEDVGQLLQLLRDGCARRAARRPRCSSTRNPSACRRSATAPAYAPWSSPTGSTRTCTGASHAGKRAGVVLDEHAEEPLDRAEQRAVDHHRALAGAVGRVDGQLEALRQSGSRAGWSTSARCGRWRRAPAPRSSGRRTRRRPRRARARGPQPRRRRAGRWWLRPTPRRCRPPCPRAWSTARGRSRSRP